MSEQLIFYALGGLIILCSAMVVLVKNPVTSAIFLVADLFVVACLYATLGAHFVAAIQILVYAGAIMVLFLFVIMLLNLKDEDFAGPRMPTAEVAAVGLSLGSFLFATFFVMSSAGIGLVAEAPEQAAEGVGKHLEQLGFQLFTKYLWPFELASFLILLAIIASVVIAKKDKPAPKANPNVAVKGGV